MDILESAKAWARYPDEAEAIKLPAGTHIIGKTSDGNLITLLTVVAPPEKKKPTRKSKPRQKKSVLGNSPLTPAPAASALAEGGDTENPSPLDAH